MQVANHAKISILVSILARDDDKIYAKHHAASMYQPKVQRRHSKAKSAKKAFETNLN